MSGQSDYERYAKDLQALRKQISDQSGRVASARKSELAARQQASRSNSAGTVTSKLREATRYAEAAVAAEKKRSELEGKAAEKEKRMNTARVQADKERLHAQLKSDRERDRQQQVAIGNLERRLRQQQSERARSFTPETISGSTASESHQYDVFISHASEDKDEVARPLYESLTRQGLKVWFDEATLTVGDSLRQKIEEGLTKSTFGVVVFSRDFFAKRWTQAELNGLYSKQMSGNKKVILPIWHNISKDEMVKEAPMMSDAVALLTAISSIEEIAAEIAAVVRAGEG